MKMKQAILITLVFLTLKGISQNSGLDTISNYSTQTRDIKSNHIPDSVFQMINLKSLSVTGMDCDYIEFDYNGNDLTTCWMVKEIPSIISNLTELEYLSLRVNAIQSIPREIVELKKLKVIDLTDNPGLEQIDNIVLIENLEELYLYGCNLTKFPNDLTKMNKLRKLGLVGNNIYKLEIDRIKKGLPNCEIIFE